MEVRQVKEERKEAHSGSLMVLRQTSITPMEVWEQIRTLTCWGAPPTTKDASHQEKLWQRALVVSNSNLKILPQTHPVPGSLTTFKDFDSSGKNQKRCQLASERLGGSFTPHHR